MAISDKIKNELFIWGNNTSTTSDLADLDIEDSFVKNTQIPKGGDLVEALILNSGMRLGSLAPWSTIEALKKGPSARNLIDSLPDSSNTDWFAGIPDNTTFTYKDQNSNINNFANNLNLVVNEYLKYSTVYAAVRARVWHTPRDFTISDNEGINTQTTSGIDGSKNVTLKLPEIIKATIDGSAKSITEKIKNIQLTDIFESENNEIIARVKNATNATEKVKTSIRNYQNSNDFILFTETSTSDLSELRKNDGLRYNSSTRTLLPEKIESPNFNGNFVECSQEGATKTITLENFKLEKGARLLVKFLATDTGGTNATLNVNNTGAKKLAWGIKTQSLSEFGKPYMNEIYEVVYDGTSWVISVPTNLTAKQVQEDLSVYLNNTTIKYNGSQAKGFSIFSPTVGGLVNQILKSNGSNSEPSWTDQKSISAGSLVNNQGNLINLGNTSQPVYFENGVPRLCSRILSGSGYINANGLGETIIGYADNPANIENATLSSYTTDAYFYFTWTLIGKVLKFSMVSWDDNLWPRARYNVFNLDYLVRTLVNSQFTLDASKSAYPLAIASPRKDGMATGTVITTQIITYRFIKNNNTYISIGYNNKDNPTSSSFAGLSAEITLIIN